MTALLGEWLLAEGAVTREQLLEVADAEEANGWSLAQALVARGVIGEDRMVRLLARRAGLAFVDLDEIAVDHAAVALIPGALAKRHRVLPYATEGDAVLVAMSEPGDLLALDDLRSVLRRPIVPVVAAPTVLDRAIARHVRSDREIEGLSQSMEERQAESDVRAGQADAGKGVEAIGDDSPVVRYVSLLISQAIQDGASDIHLEPGEHDMRVRYRIDGVLHETQSVPKSIEHQVISRVKILSDIDIAERRKPQDGRMSVTEGGKAVDLRVATLPTVWGEKVVMRVLDTKNTTLGLSELAFSERNRTLYERSFRRPYGMILVTGPTGSGKSTTLYATLHAIARPEINIITIEDPVEYRMAGVNQVQVNPKAGLTFAAALRSILRADPDVVLVGEIRDHETATIATEAALTGHLVLSTLHTNDAPSAITRLIEMGVEPFLVGSALDCVVAQRLVRRLCVRCREAVPASEAEMRLMGLDPARGAAPALYRPGGCPACARTGYRGRLAVHEVMPVSKEIERLAVAQPSSNEVAALAESEGMVRLAQDGWAKVLAGMTSAEEIVRVVSA
ncbi:MAG: Flp pilus assembly complex ATPase component TadA [Bifidobacteriaceae bacterium]|jgi:type IV pilus assembly protein PilB|nr:Flp pilus assembly complex ATPase component TadA [Bifidobacteriaceae bacterium]